MSQHKRVHWTQNMDVTQAHFIQTEDYFTEAIRESTLLHLPHYGYGLLPSPQGRQAEDGILIREHVTGNIEIMLTHCRAITSSGILIDYDPPQGSYLVRTYSPEKDSAVKGREVKAWDIILSVDPFERIPTGELDPREDPPRHPDVESAYSLHVVPSGELNTAQYGKHFLTIGRFRKQGDRYVVDADYIPPCTSVQSHPDLVQFYMELRGKLGSIQRASKAIIAKVHAKKGNRMADNISGMSRELLRYMSTMYFDFRNKGMSYPPVELVGYASTLAHTCYVYMTFLSGADKEEMLRYFHQWSEVTPGTFEELLTEAIELNYDHSSLRSMLLRISSLVGVLEELWDRLSRLEFIGQQKDNIVVSAQTPVREVKSTSGWSSAE